MSICVNGIRLKEGKTCRALKLMCETRGCLVLQCCQWRISSSNLYSSHRWIYHEGKASGPLTSIAPFRGPWRHPSNVSSLRYLSALKCVIYSYFLSHYKLFTLITNFTYLTLYYFSKKVPKASSSLRREVGY